MEINWISVIENGNPKKDGGYLVTYISCSSGPKVAITRNQLITEVNNALHID